MNYKAGDKNMEYKLWMIAAKVTAATDPREYRLVSET